jgi:hypothetical protein
VSDYPRGEGKAVERYKLHLGSNEHGSYMSFTVNPSGDYVTAEDYDHLSQRVAELEAGIRQLASECVECEGSGKAPHYADRSTEAGRAEPMFVRCKQCADIRALIAKSGGV